MTSDDLHWQSNPNTLHFICEASGNEVTLAFGYLHGEPTVAVVNGENTEDFALIPREVLIEALKSGWPNVTGNWVEFSTN